MIEHNYVCDICSETSRSGRCVDFMRIKFEPGGRKFKFVHLGYASASGKILCVDCIKQIHDLVHPSQPKRTLEHPRS